MAELSNEELNKGSGKGEFNKQNPSSKEACWYVVHTYSGYENKVKADIEKTIENRGLQDQIIEVAIPLQVVEVIKNGTRKKVQKKMWPGYVIIKMIMNDDTWYVVRNTRGVTGFVGPGSKPVPLSDPEVKSLGLSDGSLDGSEIEKEVDFEVGDTVSIAVGPLEGQKGIVRDIDLEKEIVSVGIDSLGGEKVYKIDLMDVRSDSKR